MSGSVLLFLEPRGNLVDFNKWRATAFDDIPGVTSKSILSATDAVDDSKPYRHMNLYEVADIASITESLINTLLDSSSASQHIQNSYWQRYNLLSAHQRPGVDLSAGRSTATMVTVGITIQQTPEALADFQAWYAEEHMPGMATVPGWRLGRRFTLSTASGSKEEYAAPFLAVHQWDAENGLGGDIWRSVVFTPWTKKTLETHSAPMHRRTWDFVK